jgi:tryptophan halogenase
MLLDNVEGKVLADPRPIRFITGKRKKAWVKNCVAIGLSGGFLEPLESTAIYMIQSAIMKLIRSFPDATFSEIESDEFNRQIDSKFSQVRNLLIAHYKETQRDDTEFWRHCANMGIPEELEHRIGLFRLRGHVSYKASELFNEPSWLSVLIGQHVIPESYDPRVDSVPAAEIGQRLEQIRSIIAQAAQSMPSHAETISKHCAATGMGV